jgi:hypothetical protein
MTEINETKRDTVTEKRWWWPCMHGMGADASLYPKAERASPNSTRSVTGRKRET